VEGFFFYTNGHNPNPLYSIDIVALTQDSCVVVFGGVVWGKCGYVMGRKSKTSQAPLSKTQGHGF